ncbi:TPA: DUF4224 domain-containing protein [Escherichia coli]
MNDLLNDEELVELTGYQFPSKQCGALTRAGISYVKRRDGRPRVTWTHVNAALSGARSVQIAEEEQLNFDAI